MSQKNNKIAVIGGDARQLIAAARLKAEGYDISLYGFGGEKKEALFPVVDSLCCSGSNITSNEILSNMAGGEEIDCGIVCHSAAEAIRDSFALILPLPMSSDSYKLSMPLCDAEPLTLTELAGIISAEGVELVCGGKIPRGFAELCDARGVEVFDYYEKEEFSIANAIPSAEGAIEIAMRELPITLFGASALVIGYGRIGKVLSKLLCHFGTDVTASARKESDLAWIKADGITPAKTGELDKLLDKQSFDMIFNTVPHEVLSYKELSKIRAGTLIVDLASKPGGVDIAESKRLSHNVIWALSLPGKVAPVTSGHIIADTIFAHLKKYEGGEHLC